MQGWTFLASMTAKPFTVLYTVDFIGVPENCTVVRSTRSTLDSTGVLLLLECTPVH